MKLEIFGESLDFPEESVKYLEVRKEFVQLADKQKGLFTEFFNSKYSNLDELVQNGFEQGMGFIAPAIELSLKHLTLYEIYDFDEKAIVEALFEKCNSYEDAVEKIYEAYQRIVLSEAELDEYRTRRREGRGGIIGGGFGVGGAIKGMMIAGAANAAIGAVHMAFNGVGKIFTSIGSSIEKHKVFDAEKNNQTLPKAVWQMIYNSHFLFIDILNKTKGSEVIKPLFSEERANKAQAILTNLQKFPPSDKDILKRKYIEIIQLCPFSKDLFKCILRDFGDANGGLVAFTQMIGIDIFSHKKELIKQSFLSINFHERSSAKQGLENTEKVAKFLGVSQGDLGTFAIANMSSDELIVAVGALQEVEDTFPDLFKAANSRLSDILHEQEKQAKTLEDQAALKKKVELENELQLAGRYKWFITNGKRLYVIGLIALSAISLIIYIDGVLRGEREPLSVPFFVLVLGVTIAFYRFSNDFKDFGKQKQAFQKLKGFDSELKPNFENIGCVSVFLTLVPIVNLFFGWNLVFHPKVPEKYRIAASIYFVLFFIIMYLGK